MVSSSCRQSIKLLSSNFRLKICHSIFIHSTSVSRTPTTGQDKAMCAGVVAISNRWSEEATEETDKHQRRPEGSVGALCALSD